MVNSGTGDPSAAAEIVFWFFVPAIMLMVAKAILFVAQAYASLKLMNNDRLQKALNDLEGEPQAPEFDTYLSTEVNIIDVKADANPSESANLTLEQIWEEISKTTMDKAMQGDKAARDWVTKYIFTDPVTPESTGSPFISDAVDALKSVGYKASDVRKVANQLCSQKDYASLEDLIQDIVKNC